MNEVDLKKRRNARIQMLLILAFAFLPFIAAQLLYWNPRGLFDRFIPENFSTKGSEIVSSTYQVTDVDFPGRRYFGDEKSAHGNWTLMQVIDRPCDQDCVRYILFQRQLYLTQGRHLEDLQTVVLFTDKNFLPKQGIDFAKDIPMFSVYIMDQEQSATFHQAWIDWFAKGRTGIVLLDRRGRSALYFAPELGPTPARKDLARIMRLNNS